MLTVNYTVGGSRQKEGKVRNTTARLQETQEEAKYSRLDNVHYTQAQSDSLASFSLSLLQ